MNPDGVSYLDMGDRYWKGNWQAALNPYWSPLYGWITGLMFGMTKPSMAWEYPEVHLLNLAVFAVALFCFEFFWQELLRSRGDDAWESRSLIYAWILGYLSFACILFGADVLALVTPDLIVAALVLAESGMMLRFAAGRMGAASAGLLGVLLGLGYLAKAAMFPFAVIAMVTMLAVAWKHRRRKTLVAATALCFLLVSMPFVIMLSRNQHRFTLGDSAKITQGWFVNGANPNFRHWQGNGPGHVGAQHPTRRVLTWPEVYEFATPVEGTYPVWYNPAYWYAGLDSRVHPAWEIKAFLHNMDDILDYFGILGFLTAVTLVVLFLNDPMKDYWRQLTSLWPILIPAVLVFLMYAMVYWEQRYTIGVMLVISGVVMAPVTVFEEKRRLSALRAASLMLWVVVVFWVLPIRLRDDYLLGREAKQMVLTAERLRTMGIEPGDHVALIGDGLGEYWARLDKVRIVAEVPNIFETGDSATAFWNSSPEIEKAVLDALKNTGAKAVIASTSPQLLPPGWGKIGNTKYAAYFF